MDSLVYAASPNDAALHQGRLVVQQLVLTALSSLVLPLLSHCGLCVLLRLDEGVYTREAHTHRMYVYTHGRVRS